MIRLPNSYNCDACRQIARNFSGIVRKATVIGDYVYLFVYDELEPCNSYFTRERIVIA